MSLIMLSFLACLSGSEPARCERVALPFEGSAHQCMLFGQQLVAQWAAERPGWLPVRGYRCEQGVPA